MTKGRKATPTALRVLQGNRGKRVILPEPVPDGKPVRPTGMDPSANVLWDQVVPTLADLGIATALDTRWLVEMCEWFAQYRLYMDAAKRTADAALLRAASRAWTECDKIGARFGLTPSDRTRLKGVGKKASNDVQRFLA